MPKRARTKIQDPDSAKSREDFITNKMNHSAILQNLFVRLNNKLTSQEKTALISGSTALEFMADYFKNPRFGA